MNVEEDEGHDGYCLPGIVDPVYPDNIFKPEGAVVVKMTVSATGSVKSVDIIQGIDEFNPCVTEAVMRWKFKPALDQFGKATESKAYAVWVWRSLQNRNSYE